MKGLVNLKLPQEQVKRELVSAYWNETNRQTTETCHAQFTGKATLTSTQDGIISQVTPFSILPEDIPSFIQTG